MIQLTVKKSTLRRALTQGSSFFTIILSLAVLLTSCTPKTTETISEITGTLLPHHLLVESHTNKIYKNLQAKNPKVERIILISPNHFNYGKPQIQTTKFLDRPKGKTLINWDEFPQPKLDLESIKRLVDSKIITPNNSTFNLEHGISSHLKFTNLYFPNAKIIPIIIKRQTSAKQLDELAKAINKLPAAKTLIIASIDFSHYCNEDSSLKDDQKTLDFLNDWTSNPDSNQLDKIRELSNSSCNPKKIPPGPNPFTDATPVAMDSPESLYLFLKLMDINQLYKISNQNRTSTLSITPIQDPKMNTSHLYGIFSK